MSLYVASTNKVTLTLTDSLNTPISNAVVTVTIKDHTGADVVGVTWPQTMAYQGSGGEYAVVLPETVEFFEHWTYDVIITAVENGRTLTLKNKESAVFKN